MVFSNFYNPKTHHHHHHLINLMPKIHQPQCLLLLTSKYTGKTNNSALHGHQKYNTVQIKISKVGRYYYKRPGVPKGLFVWGCVAGFGGKAPKPVVSPKGFVGLIIRCCCCGSGCWYVGWYWPKGLVCCWAIAAIWTEGGGAMPFDMENGSCTSNGFGAAGAP